MEVEISKEPSEDVETTQQEGNGDNGAAEQMEVMKEDSDSSTVQQEPESGKTIKIFVGNLNGDTTADKLRPLFEKYGEVAECVVLHPSHFGFVHMKKKDEATEAIAGLQGHTVDGTNIRVELAKNDGGGDADDKRTIKIFVGNLDADTSSDDIRPLFEKHGEVVECSVLKRFGFVHMSNQAEAKKAIAALDGHSVNGNNIRVVLSTGNEGRGSGPVKIFLGNLNATTTVEMIQPRFEKYGKVTECAVLKSFGFVHMANKHEAKKAIANLDGETIDGNSVRVELSVRNDEGGKFDRKRFNGGAGRWGPYGPPPGRGWPGGPRDFDRHPYPPPPMPYDRFDPYMERAAYYARMRGPFLPPDSRDRLPPPQYFRERNAMGSRRHANDYYEF